MVKRRVIDFGKFDATGNNRKENKVTLTVDLSNGYFSVMGSVWNRTQSDIIAGGQCVDYITDNFAKDSLGRDIRALWEVFHLTKIEKIPPRFLETITSILSNHNFTPFERKDSLDYRLEVEEYLTDYGVYTEGKVVVLDVNNQDEIIYISQGNEDENPISDRVAKKLSFLYKNAPKSNTLKPYTVLKSNRQEFEKTKEQEYIDGINNLKEELVFITDFVNNTDEIKSWQIALSSIRTAKRFLTSKGG